MDDSRATASVPGPSSRLDGADGPDETRLAALIARIGRADETAMRELYEVTSRRLHGLVLHVLGAQAAAEDALLEVYMQVWRQASRYDAAQAPVLAWLTMLARTRAIDAYRARARRARRESPLDAREEEPLDPQPDPLDRSIGSERAARVRHAVTALPGEQRRAIEAAFFGGLTHTEVAALLEQPLGTVKTRIRTGLASLRQSLARSTEGMS
ncbi:MAG TPA: sigma-70 family RNA polymerase sigma factor [Planctomycetota bacterium]|nr:sigma-70 family RNA polymerase sigma factor [Planctomycetota bacterium]